MKQSIKSYIRNQISQGVPRENISENLRAVGWKDVDIQHSVEKAMKDDSRPSDASSDALAIASFVLGICSFTTIVVFVPITGLVLGILSYKKTTHHAKAIWGIVLSSVSLIIFIIVFTFVLFAGVTSMYSSSFFQMPSFHSDNGSNEYMYDDYSDTQDFDEYNSSDYLDESLY
jgi:hypothetical protein